MAGRKNKRVKPPDSTPPKVQDKRAKEGPDEDEDTLCITCLKSAERESIECEMCFRWEHRACANITSEEYNLLSKGSSNIMFFCTHCRPKVTVAFKFFNDIQLKQNQIESKLQSLENNLAKLTDSHYTQSDKPQANTDPIDTDTHSSGATVSKPLPIFDKKFNLVVYGITEHPPKTNRQTRLNKDLECLLTCFSKIDNKIDSFAIKDYFRLGKYDSSRPRPRPLLVKFLRSADVNTLLQNRSKLTSLSIKPDLTPEQRARESLLLKERWSLIQKGFDRKQIKIYNHSVFVNNKLYCKLVDSKIEFHDSDTTGPSTNTMDQSGTGISNKPSS